MMEMIMGSWGYNREYIILRIMSNYNNREIAPHLMERERERVPQCPSCMILEIVSGNEDFTTSRWHGVTQPSGTILSRDSSISRFEHVRTWTNGYGSRSRITIINPTKTDDLPRNQHLWAVAHRRDRRLETGQIGQAPYPGSVDHHSSGFDGRKSGGRPKYVDTTWNHTRSCCRVFVLNVFSPMFLVFTS